MVPKPFFGMPLFRSQKKCTPPPTLRTTAIMQLSSILFIYYCCLVKAHFFQTPCPQFVTTAKRFVASKLKPRQGCHSDFLWVVFTKILHGYTLQFPSGHVKSGCLWSDPLLTIFVSNALNACAFFQQCMTFIPRGRTMPCNCCKIKVSVLTA